MTVTIGQRSTTEAPGGARRRWRHPAHWQWQSGTAVTWNAALTHWQLLPGPATTPSGSPAACLSAAVTVLSSGAPGGRGPGLLL